MTEQGGGGDRPARLDAVVRGRVQGVGFRYFVAHRAFAAGLLGWVANEPDGSLRCVAEGPREVLEDLLAELRRGPAGADVRSVDVRWGPPSGTVTTFGIRSGGHRGD